MGGEVGWAKLREALAQAPLPIALALLFGSRARGEAQLDSDWDLLVVSPAFRGMDYLERLLLLHRALPLRHVEYVALTPEEWAARQGEVGVVGEAAREGIVLLQTPSPATLPQGPNP
ncbi:nucleotidyltransferase domain-containing protein [Thermus tengchongensis]|uniref:Nucleotidyltransferase domain-containing protein n=1 Tax=Thermus tengchongensis TaxID=1214928 RepID=A0A4Y9FCH5_9DEIN|nr:nucleotidyltransferase domain-containing protein [Thermus tengchongensis]TFU26209.1 nucleotidyltransferase domain-containing protein [Thermus tengchongensis]